MKKFTTLETDLIKEAAGSKEAFDKGFVEATKKLKQIEIALENFKTKYQGDLRNWGYAGSLNFVNEQLDDILKFFSFNDDDKM
jgi:hypothetical protein